MVSRARSPEIIEGFEFAELAYSYHGWARVLDCGWDHKKVKRVFNKGGVHAQADGLVWISDIKDNMPHFLDSFFEMKHQRELAKIRSQHHITRRRTRDEDDT